MRRYPWVPRRAKEVRGGRRCSRPTSTRRRSIDLATFLDRRIFTGTVVSRVDPDPADVEAFSAFLERYTAGLAVERAAAEAL